MSALGHDAYEYVFHGAEWPVTPEWRFHGTVVELPVYAVQKFLCDPGSTCGVIFRHGAVFLIFFLGVVAMYFLGKRVLKNSQLALLGCVMLVISPRIFAHAFYNSRDIPNMAFFTIAMLTLLRFTERRTVGRAIVHALACALVLGIRMTGTILPVLTLIVLCLQLFTEKATLPKMQRAALLFVLYVCAMAATTVMVWPFLWSQPLTHLMDAFHFMSTLSTSTFLLGKTYAVNPWFYIPVWIVITTPLIYTLLFLTGCIAAVLSLRETAQSRIPLVAALLWFFAPITAVIGTHAQVYQEWRHVFFVYPGFLLIALIGLQFLLKQKIWMRRIVMTLLGAQIVLTGFWMLRNHPFEHSYFIFPGSVTAGNFEMDYWGLSYKQAVEFIINSDERNPISYYADSNLAGIDQSVFFPEEKGRVYPITTPDLAMYVIEHYRPDRPISQNDDRPVVYSTSVDGIPIFTIYKGTFNPNAMNTQQEK